MSLAWSAPSQVQQDFSGNKTAPQALRGSHFREV